MSSGLVPEPLLDFMVFEIADEEGAGEGPTGLVL